MRNLLSVALVSLGLMGPLLAQGSPPAETPKSAESKESKSPREPLIRALIKRLGAPKWSLRESARRQLIGIGDEALPFLAKARTDPDPERAWRAGETFKAIRWAVPKILLDRIGPVIEDYPSLSKAERIEFLKMAARLEPQDLKEGASFLTKIVHFDKYPEIRRGAGGLYLRTKPGAGVDRRMLRALAGQPFESWIGYAQAILHRRLGELEPALAAARRSRSLAPDHAALRDIFLGLLIRTQRFKEALPLAQADARGRPKRSEVWIRLGECLVGLGKREEGVAALRRVLTIPGAAAAAATYVLLGNAYLRLALPAEALRILCEGLRRFPMANAINVALADCELQTGKRSSALRRYISELRFAVPESDGFKRIQSGLKTLFERAGSGAFMADPEFLDDIYRGRPVAKAHDRLARWLESRGLDRQIVAELRLVELLWPKNMTVPLRLGEALLRLGRGAEARKAFGRVLAAEPGNIRAKRGLAALGEGLAAKPEGASVSAMSFWETPIAAGQQASALPERVPGVSEPAPLFIGGKVLILHPRRGRISGLAGKDGALLWTRALARPKAAGDIGIEPLVLVSAPAAGAIFAKGERAFQLPSIVLCLSAVWKRDPAHGGRWTGADFVSLSVEAIDPKDGATLSLRTIPGALPPIAPVLRRRLRVLILGQRSERRHELQVLDLVAAALLARHSIRSRRVQAPQIIRERVLITVKGRSRLLEFPSLKERGELALPKGLVRFFSIGAGVEEELGAVLRGGGLVRLDASGKAKPLGSKPLPVVRGGFDVKDGQAFLAKRQGLVSCFDIAAGKVIWRRQLGRSAERRFTVAGDKVFAINGMGDLYQDEIPRIVGLSRSDGRVVWKRPVELPVSVASKAGLAVVVMPAAKGATQVTGIRSGKTVNPAQQLLLELRGAATSAFAAGEFELANLLYRGYRQGLTEPMSLPDKIWHARVLAASRRPEQAENALAEAEVQAPLAEAERFLKLRKEMGLPVSELPEEPEGGAPARKTKAKTKTKTDELGKPASGNSGEKKASLKPPAPKNLLPEKKVPRKE